MSGGLITNNRLRLLSWQCLFTVIVHSHQHWWFDAADCCSTLIVKMSEPRDDNSADVAATAGLIGAAIGADNEGKRGIELNNQWLSQSTTATQVLQQEALGYIPPYGPLLTPKTRPSLGLSSQNGKRPVRDVVEPPCKISRQSTKPRLRNRYRTFKNSLSSPPWLHPWGYRLSDTALEATFISEYSTCWSCAPISNRF